MFLSKSRLAGDFGQPRRRGSEPRAQRRWNDDRRTDGGQMRIEPEDGEVLRLEGKTQASFSLMRADLPERSRR